MGGLVESRGKGWRVGAAKNKQNWLGSTQQNTQDWRGGG